MMKYNRFGTVLWVLWCAGCVCRLSAQLPDEVSARECAAAFLNGKGKVFKRSSGSLHLLHSDKGGYVFTPSDGQGFVWIGGSGGNPSVAGYSLTGDVRAVSMPSVWAEVMSVSPDVRDRRDRPERTEPVAPLLSSVWVQDAPYNGKCPYYRYADGTLSKTPCLVGCVATAVSEVIRYYAHPTALLDTLHGWKTDHYELTDVLPGTRIDWEHILDRYDYGYTATEAEAVQDLSLYCGMACRMNYGVGSSGSNISRLLTPLQRVFGYRYVNLYDRSMYSLDSWHDVLRYELRRGVPFVYSGFNFQFNGHAFVIDGMDEQGLYHVRWGESDGFYDGYFDIDLLGEFERKEELTEVGSQMGFFCNQGALAFHPEPIEAYKGDTLTYRPEDVTVDAVRFRGQPDTDGWTTASVTITNHSADTIRYTVLAFMSDTPEVESWSKVDDVGITAVNLYPESTTDFSLHCNFKRSGTHYFGLTGDQQHLLYMEPLRVEEGKGYKLQVGAEEVLRLGAHDIALRMRVENTAEEGRCGDVMAYTLYRKGNPNLMAHWRILDLAPGEEMTDTVSFGGLEAGTEYVIRVRCPWTIVCSYEFSTLASDGVGHVTDGEDGEADVYTLQGVRVGRIGTAGRERGMAGFPKGIYLLVPRGGKPEKVFNY